MTKIYYDRYGNQIPTMKEKIESLRECLMDTNDDEYAVNQIYDILGHIDPTGELLESCREEHPPTPILGRTK